MGPFFAAVSKKPPKGIIPEKASDERTIDRCSLRPVLGRPEDRMD